MREIEYLVADMEHGDCFNAPRKPIFARYAINNDRRHSVGMVPKGSLGRFIAFNSLQNICDQTVKLSTRSDGWEIMFVYQGSKT